MDIRKYSNQTRRDIKNYIDLKNLKRDHEGYNEVVAVLDLYLATKRLRTPEELEADKGALHTWLQ